MVYYKVNALDLNIEVVKFDSSDLPSPFWMFFVVDTDYGRVGSKSIAFPFFMSLFWFPFYSFLISKFGIHAHYTCVIHIFIQLSRPVATYAQSMLKRV